MPGMSRKASGLSKLRGPNSAIALTSLPSRLKDITDVTGWRGGGGGGGGLLLRFPLHKRNSVDGREDTVTIKGTLVTERKDRALEEPRMSASVVKEGT
ncbi:hypothetical protein RSOLAG1IB_00575 [Rhizoctonia solani AG-1 IB]|uniref:Uncharacterized protein n=1 Tax=Thanatephorus cucumeris (strain AG1-IB / isolate 7/3/14) TaxID=1108050 RepID=A0A0B7F758_THACB|nr:hypothetical protein RSOLAG1IB_00575 [Rhizoctonia solani AG-1 IB]